MPFAKRHSIPLVVTFHGIDSTIVEGTGKPDSRVDRWLYGRCSEVFEYASRIVAVSSHVEKNLLAGGAPKEKVLRLPIGIDLSENNKAGEKRRGVLFVGRLVKKKGIDDFLEQGIEIVAGKRRRTE